MYILLRRHKGRVMNATELAKFREARGAAFESTLVLLFVLFVVVPAVYLLWLYTKRICSKIIIKL